MKLESQRPPNQERRQTELWTHRFRGNSSFVAAADSSSVTSSVDTGIELCHHGGKVTDSHEVSRLRPQVALSCELPIDTEIGSYGPRPQLTSFYALVS